MNKKHIYLFLTFISGAIVMVFEIVGARILAPYIGTSFLVWTSIIGFVLASLSLGYYLGGKWIDKKTTITTAGFAFLGAALALLWVIIIKDDFLNWILAHVRGLKASSIFAGLVLFTPAGLFLGMVSPMMSRLILNNIPDAGKTMGSIFAWGSIGSLFGTFLAGFYLLPHFYLTHILLSLQLITALIAIIIFALNKKWVFLILSFLSIFVAFFFDNGKSANYTYEYESEYNSIKVYPTTNYQSGDSILIMQLGRQRAGGMSLTDRPLPFNYLYYFRLAEHFKPDFKKSLMLGGAAYSFPQYYIQYYPNAKMDVVEIDPEVTRVAQEYFGLKDHPNLKIYHQDARTYINSCQEKYDVIYSDTFRNAISLPYQLTTIEAVEKQYDLLNDGGVVLVNVIQAVEGKSSLFLQAELKTFMEVFPQVYLFADRGANKREEIQSTIILAIKSEEAPLFSSEEMAIDSLLVRRVSEPILLTQDILTDDFAPVDYLAFRGL
jgi:MFS family permease